MSWLSCHSELYNEDGEEARACVCVCVVCVSVQAGEPVRERTRGTANPPVMWKRFCVLCSVLGEESGIWFFFLAAPAPRPSCQFVDSKLAAKTIC